MVQQNEAGTRLVGLEMTHGIRFDTFVSAAPLRWPGSSSRGLCRLRIKEADAHAFWDSTSALRFGMSCFLRYTSDCLEADLTAAIHSDDIIAEGGPEELYRRWSVRAPGHRQDAWRTRTRDGRIQSVCQEADRVRGVRSSSAWRIQGILSKVGAKPQSSQGNKHSGCCDPEEVDEEGETAPAIDRHHVLCLWSPCGVCYHISFPLPVDDGSRWMWRMRMVVRKEKVGERKKGKPGFQGRCVQRRFWQMPSPMMAERMVQILLRDDSMDVVEIHRCRGGRKQGKGVWVKFLRVRKEWRGGRGAVESCDSGHAEIECNIERCKSIGKSVTVNDLSNFATINERRLISSWGSRNFKRDRECIASVRVKDVNSKKGRWGLTKTSQCDMLCKLGFHCKLFDWNDRLYDLKLSLFFLTKEIRIVLSWWTYTWHNMRARPFEIGLRSWSTARWLDLMNITFKKTRFLFTELCNESITDWHKHTFRIYAKDWKNK